MDVSTYKVYNKADGRRSGAKQNDNQKSTGSPQSQVPSKEQHYSRKSPGPEDTTHKSGKHKSEKNRNVFAIDAQISGSANRGSLQPRPLKPWVDEATDAVPGACVRLEDDPGFNKKWDQFEMNKMLFGISPSVGVEEQYTLPIDRTAPDFKEREANATRIARKIESEKTDNIVVMEDRIMDHNIEVDEEAMYCAVIGDREANSRIVSKTRVISVKHRAPLHLKDPSVKQAEPPKPLSPLAPAYGTPRRNSYPSKHAPRKQIHGDTQVRDDDTYRPDPASANQKMYRSRQVQRKSSSFAERMKDVRAAQPQRPRRSPKESNQSISSSSHNNPRSETNVHPPLPLKNGEPHIEDGKQSKDLLENADIPPSSEDATTQDQSPHPPVTDHDPPCQKAVDSDENSEAEQPECTTPGLNVYAEEFTPSSGYSLYTTHIQVPMTMDAQSTYYNNPEGHKYCVSPVGHRYSQVYSAGDIGMYQPHADYCPPQAYNSPDDTSKYQMRQQYYPYPVTFRPYNIIPVARMIPAPADSRLRAPPYAQRVVPIAFDSLELASLTPQV